MRRLIEHDKTDDLIAIRQRHREPGAGRGKAPALARRLARAFLKSSRHRETQRETHRQPPRRARARRVRANRRWGGTRSGSDRPQHSGGAVDEFGESANNPHLQFFIPPGVRDQLDELEPFDAIVVAMGKEIPGDQKFEALPEASRREHRAQDDDAAQQHRQLQREPPITSKPAQQHGDDGDRQQKAAAGQQGCGVQHHLPGDMDVDPPFAIARHRQDQKRHRERRRDRPPERQARIDPAACDKGVGKQEQLVGEEQAQSQADRPDVPAPHRVGVAPQVFDRQQTQDAEPDTDQHLDVEVP